MEFSLPTLGTTPSQAEAAASIGPEPAPRYIRAELISGGNTEKFMTPLHAGEGHAGREKTLVEQTSQQRMYCCMAGARWTL